MKPTITIAELAEQEGVTPNTVRRWIAAGQLPQPATLGRRRYWHRKRLAGFFAGRAAVAEHPKQPRG